MARPPRRLDSRQIGGRDARRALFDTARENHQRLAVERWMDLVELAGVDVRLVSAGREAGEFRLLRLPHAGKRLLSGADAAKHVIERVRIAADIDAGARLSRCGRIERALTRQRKAGAVKGDD